MTAQEAPKVPKPREPLLENVRRMLCEAEEIEPLPPNATEEEKKLGGKLTAGLRFHAAQMIASKHPQIADLAGRFIKEGSREIDSIRSTAITQTEWLLSEPMRSDLRKNGVDWSRLSKKPTTIFVIVPAEFLETQEGSVWLRLVIMSALRVLYGLVNEQMPEPVKTKVKETVFLLSEFPALGKLKPIEAARSQGRKHGIRLWLVIQDIHQLLVYGQRGADSFAGQCQAIFAFGPGDWESAEWMSKRSGEEEVITVSASESDDRAGVNRNYSTVWRRCWPPEKILSLPRWHGLVWFQGQSEAVPVHAAPYWTNRAARRAARPDPYHTGGKKTAPLLRNRAAIAAALAVLIGGAWLSSHDAGASVWQALQAARNAAQAALNDGPVRVDAPQSKRPARVSHPAKPQQSARRY